MISLDFNKKDIKSIPFDNTELTLADPLMLEALKAHYMWVIPSAQALINESFILVRNEAGLICPELTIKAFAKSNTDIIEWFKNLFTYLNNSPRGGIIGVSQNKVPNMSALVPLILAAFKVSRGVNYSEWDWSNSYMKFFVDKDLLEAVLSGQKPGAIFATPEELIKARDYSCTVKSGQKIGNKTKPTSQYSVTSKSFEYAELNSLPRLRKVIDCQLWVAHPSLRNKYMILDTKNLDNIPEPLIDATEVSLVPSNYIKDIDWNF